jgi:hypothetical protein
MTTVTQQAAEVDPPTVTWLRTDETFGLIRRASGDPGAFVARGREVDEDGYTEYEQLYIWQARAIQAALIATVPAGDKTVPPAEQLEPVPAGMKPGQQLAYSVIDNRDVSTIYLGPDAAGMPFESAVGYIDGPIGGVADSDLHRYPTATAALAGHQALVDGLRGPNWLAPSGDENAEVSA